MAEASVLVERLEQGVAQLTLNNPPLNLVTLEMTEQLMDALDGLEGEPAERGCGGDQMRREGVAALEPRRLRQADARAE